MAKYRINEPAHFNDPFTLVSREIEDAEGNKSDQRVGREQFCCIVPKGCVVEVGRNIIPAAYMEPMDDEAREMVAQNPAPQWHADVSALPLGNGPSIVGPAEASYANELMSAPGVAPVVPPKVGKAQDASAMRLPTIKGRT